ncbi:hypothetical protein SAMN04487928_1301 [Butyrivibrio proteoclasticus]|uniref:Uncharacterized protein n=1 Tax=Butyrivibrio proteoclasticus TaxID=43305 RepID=A0A1I5XAK4_9FIRM|nr:hypothetical protein [Butyrivibrio proteoclasticus]SFQ29005.1 hypothetical protein SAMN04487928_1301 [Butyrivibrio proteoclasticus]
MRKEEFLKELNNYGYEAELTGSVLTVVVDSVAEVPSIRSLARSCGYNYSFGVRTKHNK